MIVPLTLLFLFKIRKYKVLKYRNVSNEVTGFQSKNVIGTSACVSISLIMRDRLLCGCNCFNVNSFTPFSSGCYETQHYRLDVCQALSEGIEKVEQEVKVFLSRFLFVYDCMDQQYRVAQDVYGLNGQKSDNQLTDENNVAPTALLPPVFNDLSQLILFSPVSDAPVKS